MVRSARPSGAVRQHTATVEHPLCHRKPTATASARRRPRSPRSGSGRSRIEGDANGTAGRFLTRWGPRERARDDGFLRIAHEGQFHRFVLHLGRPLAQQPVEVFETILAASALAGERDLPLAALARVNRDVRSRGRQILPVRQPEQALLDRQILRGEPDRLHQYLDLRTCVRLEEVRVGVLDGVTADEAPATRFPRLGVLGVHPRDRFRILFVERVGEVASGLQDRVAIRVVGSCGRGERRGRLPLRFSADVVREGSSNAGNERTCGEDVRLHGVTSSVHVVDASSCRETTQDLSVSDFRAGSGRRRRC